MVGSIFSDIIMFDSAIIQNSILCGSHYSRSLEGMQLLSESFERLLYKECFAEKGVEPYVPALAILSKLKSYVGNKNTGDSQMCME